MPFDEEGSHLVRFVEDLPADADIPYPNLRRLEADELRFLKRWIAAGARNESRGRRRLSAGPAAIVAPAPRCGARRSGRRNRLQIVAWL